jgi:hypothetical protein
VSRMRFEVFTLGTLAVLVVIAVAGYLRGRSIRIANTNHAISSDRVAGAPR